MRMYGSSGDGHVGLSNQKVNDASQEGFHIALSYLKVSQYEAHFVIHVHPTSFSFFGIQSPELLQRLGFQHSTVCNVLNTAEGCYYRYFAEAKFDRDGWPDDRITQSVNDHFRRFAQELPTIAQGIKDVDKRLIQAGFDVFPWEGADMKPWVLSPGTKEIYVEPKREHEAYVKIRGIVESAGQSIVIEDPYVDRTIFELLSNVKPGVAIRVLTKNVPEDFKLEAQKFKNQGASIEIRIGVDEFHDRFILVDNKCFHVGASLKDAGRKAFAINEMEDCVNWDAIKRNINLAWSNGHALE